jgi:hypothetical protein
MSPTDACQDGLFSAVPQPIRKVKNKSSHGVIRPYQAKSVSVTETASMKHCAVSMIFLRSKLSAKAPAASAKSMIGSEVDACTSATMFAELDMEAIIQAAPTAWISAPKFEARLASQMARKVSCLKGANGEDRCGTEAGLVHSRGIRT